MKEEEVWRTMPVERDLLTVEQAAAYLHLSVYSIRVYIREGLLKAYRIAGRRKVLIPKAELLSLLRPAIPSSDSTDGRSN